MMGVLLMILSGICFSFTGVWTALVSDYSINSLMLTIIRLSSACIAMGIFLALKKENFKMTSKQLKASLFYGSMGTSITIWLISLAVTEMSVGSTSLCHYAYPIIVTIAGIILYREKASTSVCLASALMVMGLILSNTGGSMNFFGTILALASAFTFAIYVFGQAHSAMTQIGPFKLFFYNSLFGVLTAIVIALFSEQLIMVRIPQVYLCMIAGGIITDLLGTIFMTLGIRKLGATKAAFLSILEPALSNIWDVILFQANLTMPSIVGMIMIFIAFLTMAYQPSKISK